ncbi:MAG: hypothetical protein ACOY3J_13435 [Bacillota bacterium]
MYGLSWAGTRLPVRQRLTREASMDKALARRLFETPKISIK